MSKLKFGWTAGAESNAFIRVWSVKANIYVSFGDVSFDNTFGNAAATTSVANSANLKAHVVRAGVNYRF